MRYTTIARTYVYRFVRLYNACARRLEHGASTYHYDDDLRVKTTTTNYSEADASRARVNKKQTRRVRSSRYRRAHAAYVFDYEYENFSRGFLPNYFFSSLIIIIIIVSDGRTCCTIIVVVARAVSCLFTTRVYMYKLNGSLIRTRDNYVRAYTRRRANNTAVVAVLVKYINIMNTPHHTLTHTNTRGCICYYLLSTRCSR